MAGLPINFAVPGEGAIASYDWTDLDNGFGYKKLTCFATRDTSSITYHIASKAPFGSGGYLGVKSTYAGNSVLDITFNSSQVNKPDVLNGKIYVSFGFAVWRSTSGSGGARVEVSLFLNRGGVDTQIGSTWVSETYTINGTGSNKCVQLAIIDTINNVPIKKGDYFKLRMYCPNLNQYIDKEIGHDPLNRDTLNLTPSTSKDHQTELNIYLPFRIDL